MIGRRRSCQALDLGQMSPETARVAILLADISGSTPLYEAVGDAEAQRLIGAELARLQSAISDAGGRCIRQKGDDVLGCFAEPGGAFDAVRAMLSRPADHVLSIHGGLHYGQVVRADGDIFGEAVNLTARLAALANADEALFSKSFVDRLTWEEAARLRPLDRLRLKGVSSPIEVYSFIDDDPDVQTQIPLGLAETRVPLGRWPAASAVSLRLVYGQEQRHCGESQSMLIGRSEDCDLVLPLPWISRKHAVVTVRDGKAMLADRSSSAPMSRSRVATSCCCGARRSC